MAHKMIGERVADAHHSSESGTMRDVRRQISYRPRRLRMHAQPAKKSAECEVGVRGVAAGVNQCIADGELRCNFVEQLLCLSGIRESPA